MSERQPFRHKLPTPEQHFDDLSKVLCDTVYEIDGNGLYATALAVQSLVARMRDKSGVLPPHHAYNTVATAASTALDSRYVHGWAGERALRYFGPEDDTHRSPLTPLHRSAIKSMQQQYAEIEQIKIRLFLYNGWIKPDYIPSTPVTRSEWKTLLHQGVKSGLLTRAVLGDPEIYLPSDTEVMLSQLLPYIRPDLQKGDGNVLTRFEQEVQETLSDRVFLAGLTKMAALMGVFDQITYDAARSGAPFRANTVPSQQSLPASWKYVDIFQNMHVPTIGEAYKLAHSVLTDLVDPNNTQMGLGYLCDMGEFPLLVR